MTGKGQITQSPRRRLQKILIAHGIAVAAVCILAIWWGSLVLQQTDRIAELQTQLEIPTDRIENERQRTERMLFWESSLFFVVFFGSTLLLPWYYRRELKRSQAHEGFFASVTHELRTPLTSIRLQAESIADSLPSEGEHAPLIRRLLEDTNRLESQVDRVLELARVEGGGKLFVQPLRLRPWIQRLISNEFGDNSARLKVFPQIDDKTTVLADPSALQVILRNIFENSLKHGQRPVIEAALSAQKTGPWVVVQYRDNGAGTPVESSELGRLFQRGPASQGAGVGLYLVRTLMERMGGRAEFDGTRGFEIRLRFRDAEVAHG